MWYTAAPLGGSDLELIHRGDFISAAFEQADWYCSGCNEGSLRLSKHPRVRNVPESSMCSLALPGHHFGDVGGGLWHPHPRSANASVWVYSNYSTHLTPSGRGWLLAQGEAIDTTPCGWYIAQQPTFIVIFFDLHTTRNHLIPVVLNDWAVNYDRYTPQGIIALLHQSLGKWRWIAYFSPHCI